MSGSNREYDEFLKVFNQELLGQTDHDRIKNWLSYFIHNTYPKESALFLCSAVPRFSTIDDLILYKSSLNHLIKQRQFSKLASSIQSISLQSLQIQNQSKKLHIQVQIKRRVSVNFCFGSECFQQGQRYQPDQLYSVKCCSFHHYCRKCLINYVTTCLRKDPKGNMPCEGCSLIGLNRNVSEAQSKVISQSEIENLIGREERIKYYEESHRRNFLVKCESRLSSCPYKNEYIERSKIIVFECEEVFCYECYCYSIIQFIYEIINCITTDPHSYLNYDLVGIMCPNRHSQTIKFLDPNSLQSLFALSKLDKTVTSTALYHYQNYYKYFSQNIFNYCKKCNELVLKKDNGISCSKCLHCFLCDKQNHPGISCDTLATLESNYGMVHNMKSGQDRDDNELLNIYEKIQNKGFDQFKVSLFHPLQAPGLLEYKHGNLMKAHGDLKFGYLLSDCFASVELAKKEFYQGLQECEVPGMYKLNSRIKDPPDRCFIVVYRVAYCGDPVQRRPRDNEVMDKCMIFIHQDSAYLNVWESAIPKWIVCMARLV